MCIKVHFWEVYMLIKNTTVFTKETLEGLNRASNFTNEKYKKFKLIYNLAGLIFLMLFVRYMVLFVTNDDSKDIFLTVFYAVAAAVFLFIGMYLMDRDNKRRFNNLYKNMIGVEFNYEIDSDTIKVEDADGDVDILKWEDVLRVEKDAKYIYIFFNSEDCLSLLRTGFTSCTDKDLLELSRAILATRQKEPGKQTKNNKDEIKINEESIDDSYVTQLDIENEDHQAKL